MLGTKFPSRIPISMARKIQSARKRSSHPRPLKTDTLESLTGSLLLSGTPASCCFSVSCMAGDVCKNGGLESCGFSMFLEVTTSVKV